MFGSCPSKLHCFPRGLDFGQSSNKFSEMSAFFKHNFCYYRGQLIFNSQVKNQLATVIFFLYISPLKNLSLVLQNFSFAKLDGHRVT